VAENLTSVFDQAVAGEIKAGWAVENTSFSLALVSFDQNDPGVPVWEYHHLAEGNVNGTKNLTRDSQYLIGSVTKVFADLALLKSGLNLDESITKFLPALANSSSEIQWKDISLRALGSHLSGIPSNCKWPSAGPSNDSCKLTRSKMAFLSMPSSGTSSALWDSQKSVRVTIPTVELSGSTRRAPNKVSHSHSVLNSSRSLG
jgi:actin-related protein 6